MKCHNGWRQVRGTYHFTRWLLVLFLISSHAILFFNSISLTTCEWRGKVRSKNGLDMTAEVHLRNLHVKQLLILCRFHSGLSHYISNLNQHILVFQSYLLFIFISKTIIYICFFLFQIFFSVWPVMQPIMWPVIRSPLPGASKPIVPLSQPCPISFYFLNWDTWEVL